MIKCNFFMRSLYENAKTAQMEGNKENDGKEQTSDQPEENDQKNEVNAQVDAPGCSTDEKKEEKPVETQGSDESFRLFDFFYWLQK